MAEAQDFVKEGGGGVVRVDEGDEPGEVCYRGTKPRCYEREQKNNRGGGVKKKVAT